MAEQEENYWWHKGRRQIIESVAKRFLPKQSMIIADIGCGTGGNYLILSKYGLVDGIDMSESALTYCKNRGFYNELVQSGAENLQKNKYNLITAFDVLEHLENDTKILQTWANALLPHGYILLTVPAYQWLFGPHDRSLHHKRRYTRTELNQKIRAAGFTPIYDSYFFFFTFPLLCISRLLSRLKKTESETTSYQKTPQLLEKLFLKFSAIESASMENKKSFPFGSSIIIIAKKN